MAQHKGKRKKSLNKSNTRKLATQAVPKVNEPESLLRPKKNFLSRLSLTAKWIWSIGIAGIATFLGIYSGGKDVAEDLKPVHTKFIEREFVTGLLIPGPLDPHRLLKFRTGTDEVGYDIQQLQNGVTYNNAGISTGPDEEAGPWNLKFKLEKNRLYVSANFHYYRDHALIGQLDFNEWRLRTNKISDFANNDDFLFVKDTEGNICFSIELSDPNTVKLNGYYYDGYTVWVVGDKGMYAPDPAKGDSSMQEALKKIPQTKAIRELQ